MRNPIKSVHRRFSIKQETDLMQGLIFNRVCLIILVAIPLSLIINAFTKIPHISEVLLIAFFATAGLYYNSRILGNLRSSVIIFSILLNILVVLNYFFNSGIEGPSLILFILSLVFIIAVMPSKHYLLWVTLNGTIAALLVSLDYAYPGLVKNSYQSRRGLFTDTAFTYAVALGCVAFVLSYILRSYQIVRNKFIVAAQGLEEANESKTKLLSILSHDLKAPLNSVQSFLEVLADYDLDEHEKTTIQSRLLSETKNTQNMLANMLSWTKSQMDGGIRTEMVSVNLLNTLEMPFEIQREAALEKSITLETHIAAGVCVFADVEMFRLVIRNLMNNAVKFTNPGGLITVTGKAEHGRGLISVRDNGIGIPQEKQKDLFGSNTAASYGTANEKGVGLGLKLCKEFTTLQGGELSFSSSPQGTEFIVSLPLFTGENKLSASINQLEEVKVIRN
jgi:signal transduction histidine kinase